jgi:pSer/pThr/pTyr-binding forkhead associated (FHA) protein
VLLGRRPFTVGRRPDRDLVLDDDRVSRQHATLLPVGHGWALRDDGSSNGTRLNGHRIAARAEVPLRDGDRLTFGGVTFVLRIGSGGGAHDSTRVLPGSSR